MRIGIIASEFPPKKGGMEEHAGSIARWLDEDDDLTVVTRDNLGIQLNHGQIIHGLNGNLANDARIIQSQHVDCWLAMSAPLIALASMIDQPVFGYVHGLDVISPWMPHQPSLERMSRIAKRMGFSIDSLINGWRHQKIQSGIKCLQGLFSNSKYTANLVSTGFGVPLNFINVVHPGVNEDFLNVKRKPVGGPFRLVLISRLEPHARRKNVDGVIKAVAMIIAELDITLHIVGTGSDKAHLQALAEKNGIADHVIFEGAASHNEVMDLFGRCDAFILAVKPSETDVEGFGMVYAEAACAGLPSIAVNVGGVSEAVENGKTGILLEDANLESIASAIRRLAQNPCQFDTDYIRAYGRERTARQTTRKLRASMHDHLAGLRSDAYVAPK